MPAHTHAATDVVSATMAAVRLGSGAPSASSFLRGDSTWATPTGGGSGGGGGTGSVTYVTGLAAGDSSTNAAANTAVLQAALTAAGAAGGGRVVLPVGVYQFNDTVTIPSRVVYSGTGWGSIHKLASGVSTTASPKPVLAAAGNSNYVGVEDLYIDGNKAGQTDTSYSSNGVDFYSRGTTEGAGAPVYDGGLWCRNVMVYACKGVGFYVRGDATTMRVDHCYAYHNDDAGFWGKSDCEFSNCVAANNGGYGFRVYAATSVRMTSLKGFGNCQRYSGCDFLVHYCATVLMSDCQAEDSGQAGFVFTSCSHVTATNLVAYRCAGHLSDTLSSAFWIEDDGANNLCNHFTLTGSALCNGGASAFHYALTTRNLGPQVNINLRTEGYSTGPFNNLSGGTAGLADSKIALDGNGPSFPAALPTTATTGFGYLPTCVGPPAGTPNVPVGYGLPCVYDTTNHRLYFYEGGGWHYTARTA